MKALSFWLVLASFAVGCGNSHSADEGSDGGQQNDSGIILDLDGGAPDVVGADGGGNTGDGGGNVTPDGSTPDPVCGNGITEPGESCDDNNRVDDDRCNNACQWNGFCGDDNLDDGEACDDGNTFSGDGCSADCQSTEICGNGIRDIATGEVCDDTVTCAEDCRSIMGCGNGSIEAGEICDDDNEYRWDGCGLDCRPEVSMIVNAFEIGGAAVGCDYTGDGVADNRFATSLGDLLIGLLNDQVSSQVTNGNLLILLTLLGLDDTTVTTDSSIRLGWMQGTDTDGNSRNNFTGSAEFLVAAGQLDAFGNPLTTFYGSIASRALTAGPEDFMVSLGLPFPIPLRRGRVEGTITSASATSYGLDDDTKVCGAISISTLATAPNILSMFGLRSEPCGGGAEPSLGDLIVGGRRGFPMVAATQPDVDVDGDGLERFELLTTGAANCQPVIVACIDGDGTRTEGRDCAADDAFADGISIGINATAVGAQIIGAEE